MSSLIRLISVSIALSLTACATEQKTEAMFFLDKTDTFKNDVSSLPYNVSESSRDPSKHLAAPTIFNLSNLSKKVRQRVCSNGNKTLTATFSAVLRKPASNIPIDQAQRFNKYQRDEIFKGARLFFVLGSGLPPERGLLTRDYAPKNRQGQISMEGCILGGNSHTETLDWLKGLKMVETRNPNPLFVIDADTKKIYFTIQPPGSPNGYFGVRDMKSSRLLKDNDLGAEIVGTQCDFASIAEVSLLVSEYTFFPPGKVAISESVNRQAGYWFDYLTQNTTVKEAQTKDPQVIEYEATLDLEKFCLYGRNLSDLQTK